MKNIILSLFFVLVSFGHIAQANESIEASTAQDVQILNLVVGIQQTYSKA